MYKKGGMYLQYYSASKRKEPLLYATTLMKLQDIMLSAKSMLQNNNMYFNQISTLERKKSEVL